MTAFPVLGVFPNYWIPTCVAIQALAYKETVFNSPADQILRPLFVIHVVVVLVFIHNMDMLQDWLRI